MLLLVTFRVESAAHAAFLDSWPVAMISSSFSWNPTEQTSSAGEIIAAGLQGRALTKLQHTQPYRRFLAQIEFRHIRRLERHIQRLDPCYRSLRTDASSPHNMHVNPQRRCRMELGKRTQ